MLDDASVHTLLTQKAMAARRSFATDQVVLLDGDVPAPHGHTNPPPVATPDKLAYVIYTSGSTGQPKGVMIEHRQIVSYIQGIVTRIGFTPGCSFALVQPLTVDSCKTTIFSALVTGGALHILSRETALDAEAFGDYMQRHKIDYLKIAPSHLQAMQSLIAPEQLMPRKWLIVGGESSSGPWAAQLQSLPSTCKVINHYGPTETAVGVLTFELNGSPHLLEEYPIIPIGTPLPNVHVYVLDERRQPVPIDEPGELCIGGSYVARGYLNRPELTRQAFVPDPFSGNPQDRIYRTGDRVQWLPDRNIEFLGRMDDQVKIRGVRIEPREIEFALQQHERVRATLVTAWTSPAGGKQLVAYVVAQPKNSLTPAGLREFAEQTLPASMVPSAFVLLDEFPLTSHGKIDRNALPEPDAARTSRPESDEPPASELEQKLVAIWEKALQIDQVGVHDDFFDLGGQSLVATRVVFLMNKSLDTNLTMRDLFDEPTIAGLARRILAAREKGQRADVPPIEPAPRDGPLPTSFGQEAMWLISQIQRGPSPYQMYPAIRVRGPIDVPALEKAFNEILRRHESLRTTFAEVDGSPVQVIAPYEPRSCPLLDLSHLPASEQEEEVRQYAMLQSQQTLDLAQGPLARVELIRLDEQDHVVLVGLHHIIYDGWSLAVLRRELLAAYLAFQKGYPSPLPELPIQYADYAVWQRQRLTGEVRENLCNFWRKQLHDMPPLELPTDYPRPPVRSMRGARRRATLSGELCRSLGELARQEESTLFMTLLAAYQALLGRYSRQEDFAVATPVAGRIRPEIEPLMGLFVNTLAIRADLSGDPTFRELVRKTRDTSLAALDHQEMPFEQMVKDLNPPRDPSRHPVCQALLVLQNMPFAREEISELELSGLERAAEPGGAEFDLALSAFEDEQEIRLRMTYRTDLFRPETIDRMLGHFQVLLKSAVDDPDQPVSELPLLTEAERQQMLVEWNDTETEYPELACVPQLFEAQVARTPDAVAVVFEGQTLSYGELNARANRLAWHLRKLGIGPESFVGICLERSLQLATALPAVLKSGGAYVPLEPGHPRERLDFVVADSRPAVILTTSDLARRFSPGDAQVVCLDADADLLAQYPEENLPCEVGLDNAIYAIYTSGSTGKPKGAINIHRGLANRLIWEHRFLGIGPRDRVLFKTPLSFDVSFTEFFRVLLWGGRLVMARPDGHLDPSYLVQMIAREGVTVNSFVPSMIRVLLEEENIRRQLGTLKIIWCGGETFTPDLLEQLLEVTEADIYNVYGPTETSVGVTFWKCCRDYEYGVVPIGRPIDNVRAYILDEAGRPVPVGVPGELYVGGAAVGREYLNRPEWTRQAFLPDSFHDDPGARMYKTGDRACYLPDGNIAFLGRADEQIKIRGNRVELGEIEAVLRQHPAVAHAVVIDFERVPGDKRLAAYVVARQDQPSGESGNGQLADDLRRHLRKTLPDYMVPEAWVSLDQIPQMIQGKVNRQALPAPTSSTQRRDGQHVPPSTPVEKRLATVWSELLQHDRVSIHDNFFDIGGHSLLAVRLAALVRSELDVDLPVTALFAEPTIAGLARRVEAAQQGETEVRPAELQAVRQIAASLVAQPAHGATCLVPLRAGPPGTPLFCIHGMGGHLASFMPLAIHLAAQRSVYGLQGRGLEPGREPHDRIEDMAACYLDEIRGVQPSGPYLLAGWSMGGMIALEIAQRLANAGEDVPLVTMLDTHLVVTKRDYEELTNAAVMRWVLPHLKIPPAEIKKLPFDEQWALIEEKAQQEAGIAAAAIRRLANVCKSHLAANSQYTPQPYAGPVALLRAARSRGGREDRWKSICPQISVEQVPGDHYSMLRKPNVDTLAERLARHLTARS
jgi:amino acid adenylation domain-containing protein